jgi:hypothetical protein
MIQLLPYRYPLALGQLDPSINTLRAKAGFGGCTTVFKPVNPQV